MFARGRVRVSGSDIQKLPRNPSKGHYSNDVKVYIGFYTVKPVRQIRV
jgi:hypothetical protein